MIGRHHRLNGHEFEQTLGDSGGQGSLVCCSLWAYKESDTTQQLHNSRGIESKPLITPELRGTQRQGRLCWVLRSALTMGPPRLWSHLEHGVMIRTCRNSVPCSYMMEVSFSLQLLVGDPSQLQAHVSVNNPQQAVCSPCKVSWGNLTFIYFFFLIYQTKKKVSHHC